MRDRRQICRRAAALVAALPPALVLAGCVSEPPRGPAPAMYASMASPTAAVDQVAAADLLNGHRRLSGLAPLVPDPALAAVAAEAARRMAAANDPRAIGPREVRALLAARGQAPGHVVQNLSAGYHTLADAISGWRGSAPNDRVMRDSAGRRFGLASAYAPSSKYTVFWALVVAD